MVGFIIFVLLVIQSPVHAKDENTINFIKLFIINEQKPTHLIYAGLCWKKNIINRFVVEMSKIGVRTSASFAPRTKYQDHQIMYLTEASCPQSNTVLSYASSKELFQFTYRWLILTNNREQSQLSRLQNSPVLPDSDVVVAERVGNQFMMVEMHRPGVNGSMLSNPRGFYNGSLVDVRPYRELYRRRRNLMGHPISMSNVIQDSNSTRDHLPKEDRLELQYDSITKACWSAAKIGFDMLNATPQYIFSYRYGYKVNGNWSGMIADLYNNKADMDKLKQLARNLNDLGMNTATSLQQNRTEYGLQFLLIMADLSCPDVDEFLVKASKDGYFKSPYRWILLNDDNDLSVLEGLNILTDSDVVVAQKISELAYVFIEAYKIAENSEIIYSTRATWRGTDPLISTDNITTSLSTRKDQNDIKSVQRLNKFGWIEDYRNSKVLSSRRHNLRRHTLTMINVVTDSNETRIHMDDRLNLHQDSIAKMTYGEVKICFEMLNASEKLMFTHTWGYKNEKGQWEGMVDHLIKKEADLGTLAIFTIERTKFIDYIAMVGSTAVRFVFREPPLSLVSNIFALPFSGSVWLAIFVCVLGCALFLYIASKWEATMSMHPMQLDGSSADVLILIIGAVLQQGCTLEPRYAAGRCVTLILFIALTILYAAYSANIVVLLRAPSSTVRSLSDLLNSPLKAGASDFVYNRYFFKQLNEPVRKAIYDKKIAPKGKKANYYTMEDGVERIRKGLFAFHMELNPGYRLMQETYQEHEKCDLVEIDYINEMDPWVPGQKRSPFKDLYKINFLRIRESGIQANIHRRLTVARPRCSGTISMFSSVGITDMYPALIMTLYGMMLAPAVLVLEIMYKRLMKIREQRKYLKNPDAIPFRH